MTKAAKLVKAAQNPIRALGTVINWTPSAPLSPNELYSGVLDYFDWWFEIDPVISKHHDHLSPPAFAFGRDIVKMATFTNEIFNCLSPKRVRDGTSVVIASGMAEAFIFSVRSASDAMQRPQIVAKCPKTA
jgi:hypothetical protein